MSDMDRSDGFTRYLQGMSLIQTVIRKGLSCVIWVYGGDFHRNLLSGVFSITPADSKDALPDGKLRVVYEAPLSFCHDKLWHQLKWRQTCSISTTHLHSRAAVHW